MKKHFIVIALTIAVPFLSKAQSTWTSGTSTLTTTAKVGVGTTAPTGQLHVGTNNQFSSTFGWVTGLKVDNFGDGSATGNLFAITHTHNSPGSVTQQLFAVDLNQTWIGNKLRIGATAANGTYANYAFSVDGSMIAKSCVIQISNWADYVFNDSYAMPTLNELEQFISTNKHLPGVPSEKEVLQNGVEVGDMNKILLQKKFNYDIPSNPLLLNIMVITMTTSARV